LNEYGQHLQPSISPRLIFKDGLVEVGGAGVPVRRYLLTVQRADLEDSGFYACLVVKSLVDLDKGLHYNQVEVKVEKPQDRNGELQL